jgi:hypothetical protein
MLWEFLDLIEEGNLIQEKQDQVERQLLVSKLKSLNDHISNLLQKKIRIDLEIRRTKKKLSKLKSSSKTYVHTKLELEGFIPEFYDPRIYNSILLEQVGKEVFQELLELDQLIDQADLLLQEIESLPLAD